MRVGVLLTAMSADGGGGYTFEREVLAQLARLAPESPHRFVVLDPPAVLRDPAVVGQHLELGRTARDPLDRVLRLARDARIDRIVAEADVDVVWNLAPTHPVSDAPFVTTVWDLQHRLQPLFPEVSAGGEWERRERAFALRLRRAAAIVVGTETGRREVVTFYGVPEHRIHVLPHPTPGFALEAADGDGSPRVLERFRLPPRYALYPAQLWPHKNHAGLLLALRILRDRGIDVPVALVGSDKGGGTALRATAARLGVGDLVRTLGFVSVHELVALYRGASCLSYVTFFGPENLPPLEAFALGCPVLASDVAGAREQLGGAALLVDPTSPASIADGLLRLREDATLRANLVARGHERARSWTGEHFVRRMFQVLDGLVPYVRCWRPELVRPPSRSGG